MSQRTTPVPRRLGRPKDAASAETHQRLLAEARRAFARDGFDATTNREIAEAAGITAGAIYHYYPSKVELYGAVYEEVQAIVYGEFERAIAPHASLIDRFGATLDVSVTMNRDDPSIAGFVIGVAGEAERHPELVERLAKARKVNTRFMRRLARDAAERGELAADISPRAVEDLLNAMLSGLARFSSQTGDAGRHEDAVEVLKRALAGTLIR
ncbi:MAG: TetR/AcrR family transcriptional regulator [Actinomycetota bacterium]|mgnify:CR=1 FL=1|jgi:AcrR family transcriptional regulator|nr:MAG: putative TetR family transcriptional regulator [Acidimicrobiaceae bacterium]